MATENGLPTPGDYRKAITRLMERSEYLKLVVAAHTGQHDGYRAAEIAALDLAIAELEAAWHASVAIHHRHIYPAENRHSVREGALPTREEIRQAAAEASAYRGAQKAAR